jgi:CMP-N,N'-diacetyllegionaminic acid synthase
LKILGLIPARKGSKGIKNKNLSLINNKPLIWYTLKEAKKSKKIDYLLVSSDCNKIKKLSEENKIDFLKRKANLSKDNTKIYNVIIDSINFLKMYRKLNFDYVILLQPTTPLKTSKMIDKGIRLILKKKGDTLVSVCQVEDNHPARMYYKLGGSLSPLMSKNQDFNRQKLKKVFHRDGNIYIFKVKTLIKRNTLYGKRIIPLILEKSSKLNIDSYEDLFFARYKMKK